MLSRLFSKFTFGSEMDPFASAVWYFFFYILTRVEFPMRGFGQNTPFVFVGMMLRPRIILYEFHVPTIT